MATFTLLSKEVKTHQQLQDEHDNIMRLLEPMERRLVELEDQMDNLDERPALWEKILQRGLALLFILTILLVCGR